MVLAVVGIVDEVDGTVLDRSGSKIVMASRCSQSRAVNNELKPLTVECVEPPQDSVVTSAFPSVSLLSVPNRVLVSAGWMTTSQIVAGVEGLPSTRQRMA